jgi:Four helix bundle sensory module for signal transduction
MIGWLLIGRRCACHPNSDFTHQRIHVNPLVMYKKDLGRFIAVTILIFAIVAGAGFFCVSSLRREASLVAKDTLPGLIYAGTANSIMDNNFIRSLNLTDLQSVEDREKHLKQIEQVSKQTELYMEKYRQSIYNKEDRSKFEDLVNARKEYIKLRASFFEMVRNGQRDESLKFFKLTVMPAYEKYNAAGDALFNYNVQLGEKHGKRIITLSYATPIIVGIFGVVIFIAGTLVGFKATLP